MVNITDKTFKNAKAKHDMQGTITVNNCILTKKVCSSPVIFISRGLVVFTVRNGHTDKARSKVLDWKSLPAIRSN